MIQERKWTYTITNDTTPLTVEEFLRQQGYSHNVISCIRRFEDGFSIDGQPAFSSSPLNRGQILTVCLRDPEPKGSIPPVPMDLDIIYEDADLLVVNKAADTAVHPSQGHRCNSLANGLAWRCLQKGEPFVFRAINRLDRDTTGLLIVAKHMLSASILSDMAAKRQLHREYLAIVSGFAPLRGTISLPIARKEGSVLMRCVDFSNGEYACTHYQRLFYHSESGHSLIRVRLDTGRTHQIRVHFHFLGHPLPGDFLYCPDYSHIRRQALHSWRLSFLHPMTKEPLSFTAPVPADMLWACPLEECPPYYIDGHLSPLG